LAPAIEDDVRRAAAGNDQAFGKLFRTYYPAVLAGAWARLRNYADAEDAAQETFIEAWRRLPRLRNPAKFPGWLRRITVGCCGRILRRPQPVTVETEIMSNLESAEPGPASLAQRHENRALLAQALDRLSKAHRETLVLFIGGYSHKEIAQLLEVPVGTVKRRLHDSKSMVARSLCDCLGQQLQWQTKRAQSKLKQTLKIGEEGSRMKALWQAVSRATRDAVNEMYVTCDRIEMADGKINGESPAPEAYSAMLERVKYNAYLMGDRFKPGAKSQVLLKVKGDKRDFDVVVKETGLLLTLRK